VLILTRDDCSARPPGWRPFCRTLHSAAAKPPAAMDRYPARREPKGSSHPLAPTQAAGERDRDSRRPAPRLGGRNSVVWLSWSSVLQTARST